MSARKKRGGKARDAGLGSDVTGPVVETTVETPAADSRAGAAEAGAGTSVENDDTKGEILVEKNVRQSDIKTVIIYNNDGGPLPSPAPEQELDKACAAFHALVDKLADERRLQASQLQPVLSAYLRQWDEEQQRLTREQGRSRPADEIARAKKELVERVSAALEGLDLSIYRDGQPCNLILVVGESNRRGQFWLKPKGSGKPVVQKANLSDLFNFRDGEPQLKVSPPRREALTEWHAREQARRKTSQTVERGD